MSSSYSANQYESAFRSQRLQNWGDTKSFKKKTTLTDGNSTFIANDRGHLLPGLVKRGSAWPDFKGTWDLPARIPARHINPTARSAEGLHRLRSWGFDPQQPEGRQPLGISRNSQRLKDDEHITAEVQDSNVPSTSTGAHLISQNHPVSGGDHNQEDTVVGAVTSSTEEKQDSQVDGKKRPTGQHSLAEEKQAAGDRTDRGPRTVTGRAGSKMSERARCEAESSSK